MTQVFQGHVENPQPGPAVNFDAVIENVRLYAEDYQKQFGGAAQHSLPTMALNLQLLRDWGAILYPEGHDVIPFYRTDPNRMVQFHQLGTRLGCQSGWTEDDLRATVAEIACEIMGFHIHHGSERGWTICPHVPIRAQVVVDPATFEPVIAFRTSFGWLDHRKEP